MNIAWVVVISVPVLAAAYVLYGRRVAHWLGEDQSCPTPAVLFRDDRDFVPTRPSVLFGHHFATIAGAGPILGPTMAACYGYGPVWLWILIGGILFGAVHDYAALAVSLRENGRSMADVARGVLGRPGFVLFSLFTILMLVLVTAAFLNAAAASLTSEYPLDKLGVTAEDTYLKTRVVAGQVVGRIGGIASTSVIIITALAPLVGYLIYKRNLATWAAYLVTGVIAVGSIVVGFQLPLSMDPFVWMVILAVYVWVASSIPVWVLLQPRDFTNAQILYAGIALLVVGIAVAGARGASFDEPAFSAAHLARGSETAGAVWPMLFVLVACGAISGFHSLVAGGTTSKQCWLIKHSRPIAFGGMLLESLFAACVMVAVVWGLRFVDYQALVWPGAGVKANPVLAFAIGTGRLLHHAFALPVGIASIFGILMVEGFVVTTLDSAVRLNRYLFDELWTTLLGERTPRWLRHPLFNSALAVVLMFLMCYFNAFQKIWPAFGAANQLLAAMALLVISLWLLARRRQALFTLIPAAAMTVTTIGALVWLLFKTYLPDGNIALIVTDVLLILLGLAMAAMALRIIITRRYRPPTEPGAEGA
ncbi:MAG: carbon starvation protein A [Planctomycetes bacterium]|nr:carbon starvation protein A [Planctomycetota bacterium]